MFIYFFKSKASLISLSYLLSTTPPLPTPPPPVCPLVLSPYRLPVTPFSTCSSLYPYSPSPPYSPTPPLLTPLPTLGLHTPYLPSPYIPSACANKSHGISECTDKSSQRGPNSGTVSACASKHGAEYVSNGHPRRPVSTSGEGVEEGAAYSFFCIFKGASFTRYICEVLRGINTLRGDRY